MRLRSVEAVEGVVRAVCGVLVCASCCGGEEVEAGGREGHEGARRVKVVEAVQLIHVKAVVMVKRRPSSCLEKALTSNIQRGGKKRGMELRW